MAEKETEQKDDFNPKKLGGSIKPIATKKTPPSLSDYNPTPELMPMREKEILSRKDQKAKQLVVNSARSNEAPLDMGFSKLFNYGKVLNPSKPAEKKDTSGDAIKAMQSSDISTSTKGLSDLIGEAPQETPTKKDSKQLMEDARLQRKAKTKDVIAAFLTGYSGNNFDWENSTSNKLQKKRDAEFKEYKDIVQNNQKVKAAWDSKKNNDLAAYVMKLREEARNEPEKQKQREILDQQLKNYQQQGEINKESAAMEKEKFAAQKAGGAFDYRSRGRQTDSDEFSYGDVILSTGDEMMIKEIANIGGDADASYTKTIRNSIIANLYDKVTVNGKTSLVPKPGAEAILTGLTSKAEEISQLSSDIEKMEKAQEKAMPGYGTYDADQAKLDEKKAALTKARQELKQLLNNPVQAAPAGAMQTQSTGGKTAIELAIEKANAAK